MQTDAVTVRDYLRVIYRLKWALALPLALAALMFFPLWAMAPKEYRAVATVRRQDMSAVAASPAALVSKEGPRTEVKAIRAEVLAYRNLEDVIKQTKQDVYLKTPGDWQAMYDELRSDIAVTALSKTHGVDFISFEVTYPDPDLAQKIANAVATGYVERAKSSQRTGGLAALDFLSEETERYRNLLRDTEKELDDYRARYHGDLPDVKDGIRNRLLSLRIDQDTRAIQIKEAQSRLEEAEAQLATIRPGVRSKTTGESDPVVTGLEASLTQMERALDNAEGHPDVVSLRSQIAAMKERLAREPGPMTGSGKDTVDSQYEGLLSDISHLKQEIKGREAAVRQIAARVLDVENELADTVKQERNYNDLVRNQSEYTELYTQNRRQLDEAQRRAKVLEEGYVVQTELYAPAIKPALPCGPSVGRLVSGSLVFGVVVASVLLLGRALLRWLVRRLR